MIYTDNNRAAWFMELLSSRDVAGVQSKINYKSTLLISAYLDINWIKIIPNILHRALRYAEDKSLGVILATDINCYSSTFGLTANKRGE